MSTKEQHLIQQVVSFSPSCESSTPKLKFTWEKGTEIGFEKATLLP